MEHSIRVEDFDSIVDSPYENYQIGILGNSALAIDKRTEKVYDYYFETEETIDAYEVLKFQGIMSHGSWRREYLAEIIEPGQVFLNANTGLPGWTKEAKGNDYKNVYFFRQYPIPAHILVACAKIPNPYPNKWRVVNHKDCNIGNLSPENLEWCNTKYNNRPDKKRKSGKRENYYFISRESWISEEDLSFQTGLSITALHNLCQKGEEIKGYGKVEKFSEEAMKYYQKYRNIDGPSYADLWDEYFDLFEDFGFKLTQVNPLGMFREGKAIYSVGNNRRGNGRYFVGNTQVGRIVYNTFRYLIRLDLGPLGDYDVDHINNDKSDNRIFNLQKMSRKDNVRKSNETKSERIYEKFKDEFNPRISSNENSRWLGISYGQVRKCMFRYFTELWKDGKSIQEITETLGITERKCKTWITKIGEGY